MPQLRGNEPILGLNSDVMIICYDEFSLMSYHWWIVIDVNNHDKLLWWQHESVMISYTVGISDKMDNNVFPCVMKGQWWKDNVKQ